ncbi:MAG: hypothetical protein E6I58_00990 [Chloroflexi bacterium]|nr:MAG: hypothetical protein E6I58_00990 [Chloroflexota bacterium]
MREWIRIRFGFGVTVVVLAIAALIVFASGVDAGVSSFGSLAAPTGSSLQTGQAFNKTHWKVEAGDTITGRISGATDAVVGSGACGAGVLVTIQSSNFGNTSLCGTLSGSTITFTWSVPSTGVCQTTIVSYNETGHLANNAIIPGGSGNSAAGFAIVDSNGDVIPGPCGGGIGSPPAVALTVSKVASGAFDRKFAWGIEKSVDKTEIDQSGTSATFNYTVSVTHDAGTDSGWQVTGVITVFNPNLGDAVVTVTDAIADATASCSVTSGGGATIPGLSSVDFAYSCTGFSSATGSELNTGTATWGAQFLSDGEALAAGSAIGTASVVWSAVTPTLIDSCVTVTDTLVVGPLGSVCSTDASPTAFHYSKVVAGTAGTCTTVDNTAKFTTNSTATTGTSSQSVKLCVGADLTVSKTATPSFTRTFGWGITKGVDSTKQIIALGQSASFGYTVSVTHDGGTDSGWQVNGKITVTNPNDWEDITASVSDLISNGGTCTVSGGTSVLVLRSSSVDLNYSCSYASAPSPAAFTNTGTAAWDKAAAATPTGSASGQATGAFGDPTTIVDGNVTVTDTLGGALGTASYTDPSPKTFTYGHTFSGVSGTCTDYPNTATFTTSTTGTTGSAEKSVTVCVGADLTVSKTATPTFTRTYHWTISKNVDKTSVHIASGGTATFNYSVTASEMDFVDSGWQVSGTIKVSNPNDFEAITLTGVGDLIDNGGSCTITSGSPTASIPASGSVTLGYVCSYALAPSPSSFTNTSTASWDKSAASTPDGASSGTATGAFGAPTTRVNQTVTVKDTFNAVPTTLGTLTASDILLTSHTYTYSHTVSGVAGTCTTYNNTAVIVETNQGSSQAVSVCVGSDLTVVKTATPGFTRTYNWSITKAVDKTVVKQIGGSATFNYTVVATEGGFTDSGWQVTGSITVTNPNDWESITAGVADINGGSCTLSGGPSITVLPGKSVVLTYVCTFGSNPGTGTNTATATWDAGTYFTPHGTASGTATYTFGAPTNLVNKIITVTDTFNGVTSALGTVTATDTTPFASRTFTYSRVISIPQFGCKTYPNTAKIVETGLTASASVKVCGPIQTGALTIGFWQNKNGQAIITGGASTAGICNSATWLRQFAPFQDLSATATCAQVAAYFTGVFNAANAGGTTMNPMLKAQMLATALNVYFSNPSLGGNKIGAPAPIGGVTIDLTNISGSENVSAAFGGATSMTVLQMITYAAGQSTAGGSTWYANVKATQGLAKDAFDAINNQLVFGP